MQRSAVKGGLMNGCIQYSSFDAVDRAIPPSPRLRSGSRSHNADDDVYGEIGDVQQMT